MSEFFERVVYAMLEAEADLDPMSARTALLAALKEMRDPSAAMIAAAALSAVEDDSPDQKGLGTVLELLPPTGHPDGPAILADIRRDYRAMIDQAIKEGE